MKIKKKKASISRTTILLLIMFLVSSIIFARLLFLQVVNGDMYREKADTTYVRTLNESAPRGTILDRNGVVLASNQISYSVVYNQTAETKLVFYPTIDKVMDILLNNGEKLKDDFMIKYDDKKDSYSFFFTTIDENAKKLQELRLKKDNGMEEKAIEDLSEEFKSRGEVFKKKSNEEQTPLIDDKLLEYSAKDTYEYIRDKLLKISYESFFLKLCDLYKIDKNKSIEYFSKYFNYDATTENFERIMSKFKDSESPYSDDIKALVQTLGLKDKKFIKEKERAYVIIGSAMRLQLFSGFSPIVISNDISELTADIINQQISDMPGVDITTEPVRYYPFGTLASNIIGHLRSISAESSEDYDLRGYNVSKDYVGALGIESAFEEELRGDTGGSVVKLNANGRVVSTLGSMSPSPGETIQLTIDKDVQHVAEKSIEALMTRLQTQKIFEDANTGNATRGAAVMIDIETGEIIASASPTGFDPNDFAAPGKLTIEKNNYYFDDENNTNTRKFYDDFVKRMRLNMSYDELFPIVDGRRNDKYNLMPQPFINYATMYFNSPGSTFKPVTAIAGLSEGIITPQTLIHDNLIYSEYPGTENQFRDWNTYSFGDISVARAIEVSNNYFFFSVGDWLFKQRGPNKLAEYAWMFGLGADPTNKDSFNSTGIEIEEDFGQTYNDYSYRNLHINDFMILIHRQILIDNNINLEETDEDVIEIKDIKNELNNEIKDQIINNTVEESKGRIYNLLGDLAIKQDIPDENLTYAYINLINRMYEKIEESKYPGNSLNASIGQGMSAYTPLQLAVYMATLANQGERKSAHFVKNILDSDDNIVKSFSGETLSKLDIDPGHYAAILQGLKQVNYGEDGTVNEGVLNDFPIKIAGKTGSATYAEGIEEKFGRTSYAVYAGFAPADNPKVAFSVVVFDGGHGGIVAPVVLRMLEAYFKDELKAQGYTPKHNLIGYDEIDMNSFIDEIYRK